MAKVQFRQLSVSDGVTCGITLIEADIYCWGTLISSHDKKRKYKNENLLIPRYVEGPFRQISVGTIGLCAIAGDPSADHVVHTHEPTISKSNDNDNDNDDKRKGHGLEPDSLRCWGMANRKVKTEVFTAWDQISVSYSGACGVSMDSQIECFGLMVPQVVKDTHKSYIAA